MIDHSRCDPEFPDQLCTECLPLLDQPLIAEPVSEPGMEPFKQFHPTKIKPLDWLWLSNKLRRERVDRDLSQEQLAELTGVHVKVISSRETGTRIDSIRVSELRLICAVYGMTVAEMLTREERR